MARANILSGAGSDSIYKPAMQSTCPRNRKSMAHPWHHAQRSARLYGGVAADYLPIHQWFDESKAHMPDLRHRALRHHSEGIFLCEQIFGPTLRNSAGKDIPVRQ